jgi:uncharacterized protein YyaL (SSP411 family)
LAALRVGFQHLIPPLAANRLVTEPGVFLQQASHQPVDWRPVSDAAFAEARRLARPTLIVIGTPYSQAGRAVDKAVFENPEVANVINQSFLPIRIDGLQKPRWLTAFLPLSRLKADFHTGFQAFVVDTHGRLLSYIPSSKDGVDIDSDGFLNALVDARNLFAKSELTDVPTQLTADQRKDSDQLDAGEGGPLPAFHDFADALAQQSPQGGGFLQGGLARQMPQAWLFESRMGRTADMERSLDPILLGPYVDIIRGGFFNLRNSGGSALADFNEITTRNAEMASLLAELNAQNPDPLYDRLAHDAFDMLIRDMREQNLFDACRMSDQVAKNRSASASFPGARLNDLLSGDELSWVGAHLGLDVRSNPQMVPSYVSRDVLRDPELPQILTKLRGAETQQTFLAGAGLLDVSGYTAAELLRCARLWGDSARGNSVLDTVDAMESFRSGGDVVHQKDAVDPGTYLGDYTAYCEAELQDYLFTGRSDKFENGLKVLLRGLDVFGYASEGEFYVTAKSDDEFLPERINVPDLADDPTESTTAQMIQLCVDYGRLLPAGDVKRRLLSLANEAGVRYSQLEAAMSPKLAGYYLSAAAVVDPQCAIAVGPKAQELADELYRLRPARLVAAAFGAVRPDLQRKKPGIYVVNGGIVAGPYTVQEAARVMPPTLQVGG